LGSALFSLSLPEKAARWKRFQCQKLEKEKYMTRLYITLARMLKDDRGQDLVEYALLAGFIAVAAGALLPGISTSISKIFSRMASVLTNAAA
jgi:pilus assembly protein Flp/PilA